MNKSIFFRFFKKIGFIVFFIYVNILFLIVVANQSYAHELVYDIYKFSYNSDIDSSNKNRDRELYSIKITSEDGDLISSYVTYLPPECDGDYSAINQKEIKYISTIEDDHPVRKKNIIIFCGSDYGRHNTAFLFSTDGVADPFLGKIDFLDTIPNFHSDNEYGLYSVLVVKYSVTSCCYIFYDQLINIDIDGFTNNIILSTDNILLSGKYRHTERYNRFYRDKIKEIMGAEISDAAWVDSQLVEDKEQLENLSLVLIYSHFINEKELHCKIFRKFPSNVYDQMKIDFNFNINC